MDSLCEISKMNQEDCVLYLGILNSISVRQFRGMIRQQLGKLLSVINLRVIFLMPLVRAFLRTET